jgi:hypothetical protein
MTVYAESLCSSQCLTSVQICTAESEPTEGTAEPLRPNDTGDSELGKLQAKQRERVARSIHRDREGSGSIHPDLEDLSFGTLGSSNRYGAIYCFVKTD